jgi:hypothetical protein
VWLGDPNASNCFLLTRFLGTTSETSTIFKTYSSIALQLHYLINLAKGKNDRQNYEKCDDDGC